MSKTLDTYANSLEAARAFYIICNSWHAVKGSEEADYQARDEIARGLVESVKKLAPTEEVELPETMTGKQVKPSQFQIGDLIGYQGFLARVADARRYKDDTNGSRYGETTCLDLVYLAGSLEYFNWFRRHVLNGTQRSYMAGAQGNDHPMNNWTLVDPESVQ